MLNNEFDFFTTLSLPLMFLGIFLVLSLFFGFFVFFRFIFRLIKRSGSRVTIIDRTPPPLPPHEEVPSGKTGSREMPDVIEVPPKNRGQMMPFLILLGCALLLLWRFVFS
jgi:hypothetical protein